ncbi:hypothetical protein RD792_000324 [Penstemon davidsonii]|uniref:SIAH-type domain-containing protein n=1 Tax=Penstemon davidsonii TaxID=160366 RepID=A0ABR0DKD5_9LAMI|nr:hypothetical protein RD792_000324 [Penstemon davidsonii]
MQCPNGHTLCTNCQRIHNYCPNCRSELGNIRCLALEKVAESLQLPCKYQILGCRDLFPYYNKLKHEKRCPYASSECYVTGDVPYLVAKSMCMTGALSTTDMSNQIPMKSKMLHGCSLQFCLHFEAFLLGTSPVYMAFLRFMGGQNDAEKVCYALEVSAFGRKLIWQGVPRSIRDSHKEVRDSHDGLVIPRSLALYFSGGDDQELKLRIMGRIWKV